MTLPGILATLDVGVSGMFVAVGKIVAVGSRVGIGVGVEVGGKGVDVGGIGVGDGAGALHPARNKIIRTRLTMFRNDFWQFIFYSS
jgi:hypothetical protein